MRFISLNLSQKLLKKGIIVMEIFKRVLKKFVKKYHTSFMILNICNIKKSLKSFNLNQKIKLINRLKEYFNWYIKYNF